MQADIDGWQEDGDGWQVAGGGVPTVFAPREDDVFFCDGSDWAMRSEIRWIRRPTPFPITMQPSRWGL